MNASKKQRLDRIDEHIRRGRAHLAQAKALREPMHRRTAEIRREIERLKQASAP